MEPVERETRPGNSDQLEIKGYDYIELYVGNACQAAHFYNSTFGLKPVAHAGPETNVRDRVSFVVEQRNIRIVLTSSLDSSSRIADHVKQHGDSLKDIAFLVDDAAKAFDLSLKNGGLPVMEPTIFEDETGRIVKSTIAAYGDTVHSFVERKDYPEGFFPGYRRITKSLEAESLGLAAIDHVAVGVEAGMLDKWVEFYSNVLGFHQSHQEDVATDYSAMNSKVVENKSGKIKFPIMEPAPGKRRSQIEEYLMFHNGAGAQHIALLSDDIARSVRQLRKNGIEFLRTPENYYDSLHERIGHVDEDIAAMREQNILIDRDGWGYLMQIFSKPLQGRPTLFFELIQRKGARGFGAGNIKALFESIEREQSQRSTV